MGREGVVRGYRTEGVGARRSIVWHRLKFGNVVDTKLGYIFTLGCLLSS